MILSFIAGFITGFLTLVLFIRYSNKQDHKRGYRKINLWWNDVKPRKVKKKYLRRK